MKHQSLNTMFFSDFLMSLMEMFNKTGNQLVLGMDALFCPKFVAESFD